MMMETKSIISIVRRSQLLKAKVSHQCLKRKNSLKKILIWWISSASQILVLLVEEHRQKHGRLKDKNSIFRTEILEEYQLMTFLSRIIASPQIILMATSMIWWISSVMFHSNQINKKHRLLMMCLRVVISRLLLRWITPTRSDSFTLNSSLHKWPKIHSKTICLG